MMFPETFTEYNLKVEGSSPSSGDLFLFGSGFDLIALFFLSV